MGPRRVIRHGAEFICAVCRSHHPDESSALSCLERCWQESLRSQAVVKGRRSLKIRYFCRFCARDHDDAQTAEACARECRQEREAKYARESELSEILTDHLPPPPPRTGVAQPVLVVVANPLNRWKPRTIESEASSKPTAQAETMNADVEKDTANDSMAATTPTAIDEKSKEGMASVLKGKAETEISPVSSDEPTTSAIDTPQPETAAASSEIATANAGGVTVSEEDKFQRDGAQYVCKQCSKKYFTRAEVVKCYDSH